VLNVTARVAASSKVGYIRDWVLKDELEIDLDNSFIAPLICTEGVNVDCNN